MAERWRGDPLVVGGGSISGDVPVKLKKRPKAAPSLSETSAAYLAQLGQTADPGPDSEAGPGDGAGEAKVPTHG
jgi:hypothetical protein